MRWPQYEKLLLFACVVGICDACSSSTRTLATPVTRESPARPHGNELAQLEAALQARVAALDSQEVAVAFVDLETGRRIGINDHVRMHAASTMKVPILIELFRQAERGTLSLDQPVAVKNAFRSIADTSTFSLSAQDDSDSTLYRQVGTRLSLRELARLMTVRSSNLATNNLIELVTPPAIKSTLAEHGASEMQVLRGVEDTPAFQRGMNNTTTADGLARSLEIIARCKATSRRSCDVMLDILAAQEFNDMIPAGVPKGARVAHKTGSIMRIQHDGAIVYPPGQWPYVLVVLTRGFIRGADAERVGAEISAIVWKAVTDPNWIPQPVSDPRARELFALYRRFRNPLISERQFTHQQLHRALDPFVGAAITREQVGASAQGRPLQLYTFGGGPKRVLFWSQMHGNESTASMALTDLMRFIAESPNDPRVQRWRQQITLYMLPMLNPDGAARFQRQNAYGIDVNRDARALVTPEGRTLKAVHDRFRPQYGFNLHDQNPRTRMGNSTRTAAISLLAPVKNAEKTDDDQTLRAKRLAATVRGALEPFVGGYIARYDDTFNPRAFGDLIQTWGTEAVLIESGGWFDDPDRQFLRAANFAALVSVLDAIGDGSYLATPIESYTSLPQNGRSVVKLLITGGTIVPPEGPPYRAEITADIDAPIGTLGPDALRITEVGDIQGVETQDTINVSGLFLHPVREVLAAGPVSGLYITIGMPPAFLVRRGAEATSELMGAIENGRYRRSR